MGSKMTNYLDFFTSLRAPLESLPLGPYAALCIALWAVASVVRKRRPAWWMWLLKRWPCDPESLQAHIFQALPTTVLGGLFAGLTTLSLEEAAFGALSGLAAPVWHHLVKLSPAPYQGALNDAATKWTRARKAGLGSILFLLALGCAPQKGPTQAQLNCIQDAANNWRLEVASCAAWGRSAEECGLDELTAKRKEEEEACVK